MTHNFRNESTYDMQTHRCHQCSPESHHSGQRSEHIENCCTESLHLSMRLCICNSWWRVALREPKGTSIPTYFMWIGNLRQFLSSLPSEHVLVPVHREEAEMHWPLVHWNWVELPLVWRSIHSVLLSDTSWSCWLWCCKPLVPRHRILVVAI